MAEAHGRETLQAGLRAHLEYLRDLGIYDLYRRECPPSDIIPAVFGADPAAAQVSETPQPQTEDFPEPPPAIQTAAALAAPPLPREAAAAQPAAQPPDADALIEIPETSEDPEDLAIAPRKPPLPPVVFTPGPKIPAQARPQVLQALRAEIGDCTRCPLGFAGRHSIVFGDGDPNARLLFVGEGPGADEDVQGLPFVGRAGQLLNNMITAMGFQRSEVYIANIVKCRPPSNRVPEPVEAITCSQFLFRQIDIVRPQVIVALGATAATYLMGAKSPLSALRGLVHEAFGARLIVTYHPAYLLRDPRQKKEAWADLQIAMAALKR
jgi:DNA polymerase